MNVNNDHQNPVIFAMNGATSIAQGIEAWIRDWIPGFSLAEKEEWRRKDREGYALSKVNVRGRRVYIIQSFATDEDEAVDEKFLGTLLFASSLRTASAAEVTLVAEMLPYMRQDKKDKPRAPIDTAYVARHCWAAGINRIITMDVHNKEAMQNSCGALYVNFDHLEARCPLTLAVCDDLPDSVGGSGRDRTRVVVLAPDGGATKRAKHFQASLAGALHRRFGRPVRIGFAHGDKVRLDGEETEITTIIEDPNFPIAGALVISPDDILATGSTLREIESAVRQRGGEMFGACVTHGIFIGAASENLERIPRVYTTRTVCPWRVRGTPLFSRIKFVEVDSIFARAIKETHMNGSINNLMTSLEVRPGESPNT